MPRQSPCGAGKDANVAKKGQKRARGLYALPNSGAKQMARTTQPTPQEQPSAPALTDREERIAAQIAGGDMTRIEEILQSS